MNIDSGITLLERYIREQYIALAMRIGQKGFGTRRDTPLFESYITSWALDEIGVSSHRALVAVQGSIRTVLKKARVDSSEAMARSLVAMCCLQTSPDVARARLAKVLRAQQNDGGWKLEGSDTVLQTNSEIGPTLPCLLAIRKSAEWFGRTDETDRAITSAREFSLGLITDIRNRSDLGSSTMLAGAWSLRGYCQATSGVNTADPAVGECARNLWRALVDHESVLQCRTELDLQISYNVLHGVALSSPGWIDLDELLAVCSMVRSGIMSFASEDPECRDIRYIASGLLAFSSARSTLTRARLIVPVGKPPLAEIALVTRTLDLETQLSGDTLSLIRALTVMMSTIAWPSRVGILLALVLLLIASFWAGFNIGSI